MSTEKMAALSSKKSYQKISVEFPNKDPVEVILSQADIQRLENGEKQIIDKIEEHLERVKTKPLILHDATPVGEILPEFTNQLNPTPNVLNTNSTTLNNIQIVDNLNATQNAENTSAYGSGMEKSLLWEKMAVIELIRIYAEKKQSIKNIPQPKRNAIWTEISQLMGNAGYDYSPALCSGKIRALKHRYKTIIEDPQQVDTKWKYFTAVHNMMTDNPIDAELPSVEKINTDDDTDANMLTETDFSFFATDPAYETYEQSDSWGHNNVLLLISLYAARRDQYYSNTVRRLHVWTEISREMSNHGFDFSPETCAGKMRGLKFRYRRIMETSKKKQREITWEFFPAMQSLMAEEPEFVKNSEGYKKAKLALKDESLSTSGMMFNETTAKKRSMPGDFESEFGTDSGTVPTWFANFANQQADALKRLTDVQERMVQSMEKQNEVLSDLKNVLTGIQDVKPAEQLHVIAPEVVADEIVPAEIVQTVQTE